MVSKIESLEFAGIELESELCLDFVTGEPFISALKEAGRITKRTGYEAGFVVENDFSVSEVVEGTTDSTALPIDLAVDQESRMTVHFHPDNELFPSGADLSGITAYEESHVLGVAIIDEVGSIDLLLIKTTKKLPYPLSVFDDFYDSASEDAWDLLPVQGNSVSDETKKGLLDILNKSGLFKAVVITLGDKDGGFSQTEKESLQEFFRGEDNA